MIKNKYDVIVIGLGLVGSAALWKAAKLKAKVLGLERFSLLHNLGSSHGESRIYRQAIGEGDFYTPYALRSYELFRKTEELSGHEILKTTGGLIMVSQNDASVMHGNSDFLGETKKAAEKYNIPHEILGAAEIHKRFPQFNLTGDEAGYYEPSAGILKPENAIKANIELARRCRQGVEVKDFEEVIEILVSDKGDYARVRTVKGDYYADKVIVAMGSWVSRFIPKGLKKTFKIYRQVSYNFDIRSNFESFLPGKFPIFIWQRNGKFLYGFPAINGKEGGMKFAGEDDCVISPEDEKKRVTVKEVRDFYERQIRDYFLDLSSECVRALTCKYTNTPDRHFVIDFHPEHKNIVIASPCSGHGAKHSAATGEAAAELAISGKTTLRRGYFAFSRFSN